MFTANGKLKVEGSVKKVGNEKKEVKTKGIKRKTQIGKAKTPGAKKKNVKSKMKKTPARKPAKKR
jgi:hypothetical protein